MVFICGGFAPWRQVGLDVRWRRPSAGSSSAPVGRECGVVRLVVRMRFGLPGAALELELCARPAAARRRAGHPGWPGRGRGHRPSCRAGPSRRRRRWPAVRRGSAPRGCRRGGRARPGRARARGRRRIRRRGSRPRRDRGARARGSCSISARRAASSSPGFVPAPIRRVDGWLVEGVGGGLVDQVLLGGELLVEPAMSEPGGLHHVGDADARCLSRGTSGRRWRRRAGGSPVLAPGTHGPRDHTPPRWMSLEIYPTFSLDYLRHLTAPT